MAKKFAIGLNYFFDNQSNSGIVNYIYNIVAALKTLDDSEKPKIVLFYSANSPIDYIKTIDYPFIEYVLFNNQPSNVFVRKLNSLILRLFKKDIHKQLAYFYKIDVLYPYFDFVSPSFAGFKNKVHWLVDFNNCAFPSHYNDNGATMIKIQKKVTSSSERVVLSSNALFDELNHYYPEYKCDIRVLRFASSLPGLNQQDVAKVKDKYHIDLPYLMSPNQLWEHKNQALVLDALHIIKLKGLKIKVLFSGSLEVNRGKGLYIDLLQKKVSEYQLEDSVSFLGVLDRNDQLLLMKGAEALLQPSLYEGWSTLVEEAKALNKFIILSDLPVHREQISENVTFFNPFDAVELSDKIIKQLTNAEPVTPTDYIKDINNYGRNILNVLTK